MQEKLEEIKETLFEIKLDLREHMRRTDINETMLKEQKKITEPMWKAYIGAKWSIAAIITIGTIVGMYMRIL